MQCQLQISQASRFNYNHQGSAINLQKQTINLPQFYSPYTPSSLPIKNRDTIKHGEECRHHKLCTQYSLIIIGRSSNEHQHISTQTHTNHPVPKLITVNNKSVSRKHALIKFPIFSQHSAIYDNNQSGVNNKNKQQQPQHQQQQPQHQQQQSQHQYRQQQNKQDGYKSYSIIPSYYSKIFPQQYSHHNQQYSKMSTMLQCLSKQLLDCIRSYAAPYQAIVVRDLNSKYGLLRLFSAVAISASNNYGTTICSDISQLMQQKRQQHQQKSSPIPKNNTNDQWASILNSENQNSIHHNTASNVMTAYQLPLSHFNNPITQIASDKSEMQVSLGAETSLRISNIKYYFNKNKRVNNVLNSYCAYMQNQRNYTVIRIQISDGSNGCYNQCSSSVELEFMSANKGTVNKYVIVASTVDSNSQHSNNNNDKHDIVSIGRQTTNTISFSRSDISRKHCALLYLTKSSYQNYMKQQDSNTHNNVNAYSSNYASMMKQLNHVHLAKFMRQAQSSTTTQPNNNIAINRQLNNNNQISTGIWILADRQSTNGMWLKMDKIIYPYSHVTTQVDSAKMVYRLGQVRVQMCIRSIHHKIQANLQHNQKQHGNVQQLSAQYEQYEQNQLTDNPNNMQIVAISALNQQQQQQQQQPQQQQQQQQQQQCDVENILSALSDVNNLHQHSQMQNIHYEVFLDFL